MHRERIQLKGYVPYSFCHLLNVSSQLPARNSRKLPRIGRPVGPGGYRFFGSNRVRNKSSRKAIMTNARAEIRAMPQANMRA